jgi:hypothetical protein
MDDRQDVKELAECRMRIAELERENRQLRESACMFAELAERLHERLDMRRPRLERSVARSESREVQCTVT